MRGVVMNDWTPSIPDPDKDKSKPAPKPRPSPPMADWTPVKEKVRDRGQA